MFVCEVLVGERLGPIYAGTTSTITEDEVATLNHEVLDLFQEISLEIGQGVEAFCRSID